MIKIIFSFLCLGLVVSACSGDQPRQETALSSKARELISEKDRILAELTEVDEISEAWADIELDQYQSKLERLSKIEEQLTLMDGKEGLRIHSPKSDQFVAKSQNILDQVRQRKSQSERVDEDQTETETDDLSIVRHTFLDIKDQILAEDFVHDDMSEEELQASEDILKQYKVAGQIYRVALKAEERSLRKKGGGDEIKAKLDLLKIQVAPSERDQIEEVVKSLREKIQEVRKKTKATEESAQS